MSVGVATVDACGAHDVLSRAAHTVVDQFATVLDYPADDLHGFSRDTCLLGCSCFSWPGRRHGVDRGPTEALRVDALGHGRLR